MRRNVGVSDRLAYSRGAEWSPRFRFQRHPPFADRVHSAAEEESPAKLAGKLFNIESSVSRRKTAIVTVTRAVSVSPGTFQINPRNLFIPQLFPAGPLRAECPEGHSDDGREFFKLIPPNEWTRRAARNFPEKAGLRRKPRFIVNTPGEPKRPRSRPARYSPNISSAGETGAERRLHSRARPAAIKFPSAPQRGLAARGAARGRHK